MITYNKLYNFKNNKKYYYLKRLHTSLASNKSSVRGKWVIINDIIWLGTPICKLSLCDIINFNKDEYILSFNKFIESSSSNGCLICFTPSMFAKRHNIFIHVSFKYHQK